MQQEINHFIEESGKIELKYLKLLDDLESTIEKYTHDSMVTLEKFKSQYEQERKEILEKNEYLNAEIDRYQELLKKEYKIQQLSGKMNDRFKELQHAVHEYVILKNNEHTSAFQLEFKRKQEAHDSHLKKLKQQEALLKDEFQGQVDKLLEKISWFKNDTVNTHKSTCEPALIQEFSDASFESTCDEYSIGEKSIEFNKLPIPRKISLPHVVQIKDRTNVVIYYNAKTASIAESISDVFILRVLLSHLPDKLKLHIYDKSMNEKFREFLSLPSNIVIKGFDWNQFIQDLSKGEESIRGDLSRVWSDITSDHQTLNEYNVKLVKQEKYDDIVPFRLFVLDDFLGFMNAHEFESAIKRIDQLVTYGCNALIMVNTDESINHDKLSQLVTLTSNLRFKTLDLTEQIDPSFMEQGLIIENLPSEHKKTIIKNFLNSLNNLEASRSKLKFTSYLLEPKDHWFNLKTSREVKIPIGKSDHNDGFENLTFETKGMLSSALLCGGVGSGKTNLLKCLITSLSLNYSPEDLEIWLVDMKNGAGFSVFRNLELPHVTKYAFSAESELIKDLFYQLNKEMEDRYAYFAQFSIDNLDDAAKRSDVDSKKLRRIVLIIDEFASIFSDDDPFIEEISRNLLTIILKGRAMGINILLAAQNFNNIRNSTFTQAVPSIPIRIILKSSPDAARSILGSSNNNASLEITRIGQGLINTNFGELNSEGGNNYFKSFLLDNEDLTPLLESIRDEVKARNLATDEVVFLNGASPAEFAKNSTLFLKLLTPNYQQHFTKMGIHCYLGESYLMNNDAHFCFPWKINGREASQNIIISGNEREYTMQAVFSTLSSVTYSIPEANFRINFVNPFDKEFSQELGFDKLAEQLTNYDFQLYAENEFEVLIAQLEQLLAQRRASSDKTPVITYLVGLEKFMKIKKLNTYDSETEITQRLKVLLSTGSQLGIYFVMEINKASNLEKISRDILGFSDHRIGFYMNMEESNLFINSKAANQLVNLDSPTIRFKGVYYAHSQGIANKFKSYINLASENQFCRGLREKVASQVVLTSNVAESNATESSPQKIDASTDSQFSSSDLEKAQEISIDTLNFLNDAD
jgi:hypothetical protein